MHIDRAFTFILCTFSRQVAGFTVDSFSKCCSWESEDGIPPGQNAPAEENHKSHWECLAVTAPPLTVTCISSYGSQDSLLCLSRLLQKKRMTKFSRLSYIARTLHSYTKFLIPKPLSTPMRDLTSSLQLAQCAPQRKVAACCCCTMKHRVSSVSSCLWFLHPELLNLPVQHPC